MKKSIIFAAVFFISCLDNVEMKNIDGFSSIVYFSKISDIFPNNKNMLVLGKNRYKVQYRFQIDKQYWNIGDRIENTYVTINSTVYKLAEILMDTTISCKKVIGKDEIKINKEDITKHNTNENDLYGKITVSPNKDYIYITIAWMDLKLGKYSFINIENNNKIILLNPELIIGLTYMR